MYMFLSCFTFLNEFLFLEHLSDYLKKNIKKGVVWFVLDFAWLYEFQSSHLYFKHLFYYYYKGKIRVA